MKNGFNWVVRILSFVFVLFSKCFVSLDWCLFQVFYLSSLYFRGQKTWPTILTTEGDAWCLNCIFLNCFRHKIIGSKTDKKIMSWDVKKWMIHSAQVLKQKDPVKIEYTTLRKKFPFCSELSLGKTMMGGLLEASII